jgi:hypothetical protein
MLSGRVFRQQMWAPAIGAIGGGALPTPTTQEWKRRGPNSSQQGLSNTENWALPTPRSCSAMTAAVNSTGNQADNRFPNLETVIGAQVQTTPQAGDPGPALLLNMLPCLPTPTRSDHVDCTYHYPACVGMTRGEKLSWALGAELGHNNGRTGQPGVNRSIPTGEAMYLNPSFVEEMMGFPVGWTV